MNTSMMMKAAREWAIFRHTVLWYLQGAQPEAWPAHMFWVRAVYGR